MKTIYVTNVTVSPVPPGPYTVSIQWRYANSTGPFTIVTYSTPVNPAGIVITPVAITFNEFVHPEIQIRTIYNGCSSTPYDENVAVVVTTSTTTSTTNPLATMWSARYSITEGALCSSGSNTVYTDVGDSFTSGDIVYTDGGLTTPLVGFNFIVELVSGTIYNINNATGQIQLPTGNSC